MKFVLMLSLLLCSISLRAETCGEVDLRKQFGPVRNQDGSGWCYAYAAADLIGFKNYSPKKPTARVSAADLATQYIKSRNGENIRAGAIVQYPGGQMHNLLTLVAKTSVCTEQDIPSEVNNGPGIKEAYYNMYKVSRDSKTNLCSPATNAYKNFFPRTSIAKIEEVLKTSQPWEVVLKLQKLNCPQRYNSNVKLDEVGYEPNKENFYETINAQLDSQKPIGISYKSGVIYGSKSNGPHASVLVGRRMTKARQCEYLIRNSHGRSCDGYKNPKKCIQGNIWVSENELFPSLTSITYIK